MTNPFNNISYFHGFYNNNKANFLVTDLKKDLLLHLLFFTGLPVNIVYYECQ